MPRRLCEPEKICRSEAMLDVTGDVAEASDTVGECSQQTGVCSTLSGATCPPAADSSRKVQLALRKGLVELRLQVCAEVNRLEDLVSSSMQGMEAPDLYAHISRNSSFAGVTANDAPSTSSRKRSQSLSAGRNARDVLAKSASDISHKGLRSVAEPGAVEKIVDMFAIMDDAHMQHPQKANGSPTSAPKQDVVVQVMQEEEEEMKHRASRKHDEISGARSDSARSRGFSLQDRKKKSSVSILQRITRSRRFEVFFTTLILGNSILLAAQVQFAADHLGQAEPSVFTMANYACNAIFAAELALRICAEGFSSFFCDSATRSWAILDTVVVLVSLVEFANDAVAAIYANSSRGSVASGGHNMRMLRMIRVARILRTFRAFRLVRYMSALQTLLFSILVTLKSLLWASVLMLSIIYVFAITMTQCSTESGSEDIDPLLLYYWGSLDTSMSTLFQAISNGVSWREAYEVLYDNSWMCGWLFNVFVVFTYFVMLNVITGVFCNSAIESAQKNPELIAFSLMQGRKKYIENLSKLFEAVDADESGTITISEFEELLRDDMAHAHFQALELNIGDAWTLFKLIDHDASGTISINEFLTGCEALKGGARSIDVASILYESRLANKKLFDYVGRIEAILMSLHDEDLVQKQLPSAPSALFPDGEILAGMGRRSQAITPAGRL